MLTTVAANVGGAGTLLAGTRWRVDAIMPGKTKLPVPAKVRATITIGKNGELTGSTGCNTMSTPVKVTTDQLVVSSPVVTTEKACARDVMDVENTVLATPQKTVSYSGVAVFEPLSAGDAVPTGSDCGDGVRISVTVTLIRTPCRSMLSRLV